jgi:cysteine desulfurase
MKLNLEEIPIDFIVPVHKFMVLKVFGFAFVRKIQVLQPMFYGGETGKGLRPGTEALHQCRNGKGISSGL